MIIVAGWLRVAEHDRDGYLDGCRDVIVAARSAAGCLDFHLSADLIELDRINVFERWESVADLEAFRGSGPGDDQASAILAADVSQYEVTETV